MKARKRNPSQSVKVDAATFATLERLSETEDRSKVTIIARAVALYANGDSPSRANGGGK